MRQARSIGKTSADLLFFSSSPLFLPYNLMTTSREPASDLADRAPETGFDEPYTFPRHFLPDIMKGECPPPSHCPLCYSPSFLCIGHALPLFMLYGPPIKITLPHRRKEDAPCARGLRVLLAHHVSAPAHVR